MHNIFEDVKKITDKTILTRELYLCILLYVYNLVEVMRIKWNWFKEKKEKIQVSNDQMTWIFVGTLYWKNVDILASKVVYYH